MAYLVELNEPRKVGIRHYQPPEPGPGEVGVRTLYSGISAGTELTAYRGTNPYLANRAWDPDLAFPVRRGERPAIPSTAGLLGGRGRRGGGPDVDRAGPWRHGVGHLGPPLEAVLPAERFVGCVLPDGLDPVAATFARVGAVALNAVLAADVHLGEIVAVFGQGVSACS